ncbi:MAG: thioether cross-link-forming SCIFF peptide maturase [Clostridiales bacterium]|jgi:uncharacterized protein|nr:thioether cross-link-forming SCIFF peptide maturase [Clostridiales bacterium]
MAHTFRALNKYFLSDPESGSLFEIDELTRRVYIAQTADGGRQGKENAEVKDKTDTSQFSILNSQFRKAEIAEAEAELGRLRAEGLLDAPAGDYPRFHDDGVVKALCLNVSHACNLACEYCFAGEGDYGSQTASGPQTASGAAALMSAETAGRAVDFLIARSGKRRNLEIDFFGGEPLLNFGVVRETVEYAKKRAAEVGKTFKFTVTTNGVLLTGETADYINSEFYNAVISIDGRKEVHNLLRRARDGSDRYDEILGNARRFVKARGDKSWYVRGTFTNRNLDFARDAEALADAGFAHISLEPVVLPENHPLAIREEHVPRIAEEYDRLAGLYTRRGREGRPFEFFHFNIDLEGAPCREKLVAGCGAGCQYLAVNPSGDIYPCHRYDGVKERVLGNVNAKNVDIDPEKRKKFAEANITKFAECRVCWAKFYCGGGCGANAEFYCGGRRPYGVACALLRKRTELALALYAMGIEN